MDLGLIKGATDTHLRLIYITFGFNRTLRIQGELFLDRISSNSIRLRTIYLQRSIMNLRLYILPNLYTKKTLHLQDPSRSAIRVCLSVIQRKKWLQAKQMRIELHFLLIKSLADRCSHCQKKNELKSNLGF